MTVLSVDGIEYTYDIILLRRRYWSNVESALLCSPTNHHNWCLCAHVCIATFHPAPRPVLSCNDIFCIGIVVSAVFRLAYRYPILSNPILSPRTHYTQAFGSISCPSLSNNFGIKSPVFSSMLTSNVPPNTFMNAP